MIPEIVAVALAALILYFLLSGRKGGRRGGGLDGRRSFLAGLKDECLGSAKALIGRRY